MVGTGYLPADIKRNYMQRFAAKQEDASGAPLFYLLEYEVTEHSGTFFYEGRVLATNDVNKELGDHDEAFRYSFERSSSDWSLVNKIKVTSVLGDDFAEKVRNTIFNDLVLSGTMSFEQQKN